MRKMSVSYSLRWVVCGLLACSDAPQTTDSNAITIAAAPGAGYGPTGWRCIPRDQARPMPSTASEYA